jgi:hypothetical protein
VADGCLLLRLGGVALLVDCPLDLRALAAYVPQYRTQPWDVGPGPAPPADPTAAGAACVVTLHGQERLLGAFQLCAPRWDTVPVAAIDVVLISNAAGMLALPYLVRQPGFRARVVATEPTRELGRCASPAARPQTMPLPSSITHTLCIFMAAGGPLWAGRRWWSWCSC